jgi:hypothetical protein
MSVQFIITFVPRANIDAIKAVRRLLKFAGRHLGLRAIDCREHDDTATDTAITEPNTEEAPVLITLRQ